MANTSPEVIKSFLVNLGFNVSPSGFHNFKSALSSVSTVAKSTAKGVLAISTAAQAAVTVFSNQMEKLYYSSKRAGSSVSNIQALEFGFGQIGLEAEDARRAVEGMASAMRSNPGMEALLNQMGVETSGKDRVDVLLSFIEKLKAMPFYQAKQYASMFGIGEDQLFMLTQGLDKLKESVELRKQLAKNMGWDGDSAAEQAVKYQNAVRGITEKLEILYQTLVLRLMPYFTKFVEELDKFFNKAMKAKTIGELFPPEWGTQVDSLWKNLKKIDDTAWFKGLMDATKRASHGLLDLLDALLMFAGGDSKGAKKALNSAWEWFTDTKPKEAPKPKGVDLTPEQPLPNNVTPITQGVDLTPEQPLPNNVTPITQGKRLPYGLRHNNPGNLMTGSGGTMGTYSSYEEGLNAMAGQLIRYGKRGLDTISKIINTYSPGNGKGNTPESTMNYIKSVSKALGISEDAQLNLNDPETLSKLMKAMIRVEQGGVMPFSDTAIADAARLKTGTNITQTNNITIHGSSDPNAAGAAVGREIKNANAEVIRNKRANVS